MKNILDVILDRKMERERDSVLNCHSSRVHHNLKGINHYEESRLIYFSLFEEEKNTSIDNLVRPNKASCSYKCSHTHTLTHTHAYTHTHTHIDTHTHTHTFTRHTRINTLTNSLLPYLPRSYTLSLSHTQTHTLFLTHKLSLSPSLSRTLLYSLFLIH